MTFPLFRPGIALVAALAGSACSTPVERPQPTAPGATAGALPSAPAPPVGGNPSVGGAEMLPTRSIVDNAAAAPTLSILVGAMTAAGLAPTLSAPGPFTLFAPTNEAFGRMAPGIVDQLMKPENKPTLARLLSYHAVAGAITSTELIRRIRAGGGAATLTTLAGQPLTATMVGGIVALTDVGGNRSYIETADVRQANGIVHVVNGVLVPRVQ